MENIRCVFSKMSKIFFTLAWEVFRYFARLFCERSPAFCSARYLSILFEFVWFSKVKFLMATMSVFTTFSTISTILDDSLLKLILWANIGKPPYFRYSFQSVELYSTVLIKFLLTSFSYFIAFWSSPFKIKLTNEFPISLFE